MRVNGKKIEKDHALYGPLVFKRFVPNEDGEREETELAFWAQPVWNYTEFRKLCPKPVNQHGAFMPPKNGEKGGFKPDDDHPQWQDELLQYANKREAYFMLKTLQLSFKPYGDLEWENVVFEDPSTWHLVNDELLDLLSHYEFIELLALIEEANALDPAKLEANRQSFFTKRETMNPPKKKALSGSDSEQELSATAESSKTSEPATDGQECQSTE